MLLPAPVWPTTAIRSPGRAAKSIVAQRPLPGLVGERDARELERSEARRLGLRRRPGSDLRLGREQALQALRRRQRRLQDVVVLGEVGDRPVEPLHVLQERDQNPERDGALRAPQAAEREQQREAPRGEQLDRRVEDGVVGDAAHVDVAVRGVDRDEARVRPRLGARELHRRDPGDVLLQVRVDRRQTAAHLAVDRAGAGAEPRRQQHHQRQHGERHQRQPPVESEQHAGDAAEQGEVGEDVDQPGGEDLVERLDVAGQPGDHAPGRGAVEPRQVEPLQVGEQLGAQVAHHELPGHHHRPALGRQQQRPEQQGDEVERRQRHQPGGPLRRQAERGDRRLHPHGAAAGARLEVEVDRRRGEQRSGDLQRRAADHQGGGYRDAARVRLRPPQQPPDQAAVGAGAAVGRQVGLDHADAPAGVTSSGCTSGRPQCADQRWSRARPSSRR